MGSLTGLSIGSRNSTQTKRVTDLNSVQNTPSTAAQESSSSQISTGLRPLPSISTACSPGTKCAAVLHTNLTANTHNKTRTARSRRVILRYNV